MVPRRLGARRPLPRLGPHPQRGLRKSRRRSSGPKPFPSPSRSRRDRPRRLGRASRPKPETFRETSLAPAPLGGSTDSIPRTFHRSTPFDPALPSFPTGRHAERRLAVFHDRPDCQRSAIASREVSSLRLPRRVRPSSSLRRRRFRPTRRFRPGRPFVSSWRCSLDKGDITGDRPGGQQPTEEPTGYQRVNAMVPVAYDREKSQCRHLVGVIARLQEAVISGYAVAGRPKSRGRGWTAGKSGVPRPISELAEAREWLRNPREWDQPWVLLDYRTRNG
jgi:hypothetical protein